MTRGRKACKGGDRCTPRTLAEAIYCCVFHSALDVETIAERLGVTPSYLRNAANPDRDDIAFQSRHLIPLMLVTNNKLPLHFMAIQVNALVVEMPAVPESDESILAAFVATTSRLGEDGARIQRALADHQISADEADEIIDGINGTMTAAASMKQLVIERSRPRPMTGRLQ